MWVPIVPQAEFDRLNELIRDLNDAESIINRLGPPDYDAMTETFRTNDGITQRDESAAPMRCIEY